MYSRLQPERKNNCNNTYLHYKNINVNSNRYFIANTYIYKYFFTLKLFSFSTDSEM